MGTEWVDRARDAAKELAVDALQRDRANKEPFVEAELLRRHRLPALLVPTGYGGAGESWATALAVVRELATVDGSIAQLLGYHYVNQANLWLAGTPEVAERLGRPSAQWQWLWGDAVNPIEPELTLTPDGDGYRLDGTKSFSTGASVGDVTVASGTVTTTGEPLLVAVPRDAEGIDFGGDWDNLGQRLSASGSVTFTGTPVDGKWTIGSLAPTKVTPRSSLITPAIQAVFGHFYLGIAEGALAAAAEYTRTRSRPWTLGGLASATEEPYVLAAYGAYAARLDAVGAQAERVAARLAEADACGADLTWDERGELAVAVARLKVVATDAALDVTSGIYEVTGARATANRYGFDRFWRNVRTHTLHDPVAYKRREVGAHYLTGAYPEFTLYT
ncbi:acyl-CoA dehydrogenase family protein [Phytohabitans suffuscus]|uniref:Putative monooxygenase n=1 Tax=Phytohabitans suffuscus TaxID=624315 RepID=A0A6F8YUC8_9ACTN|nr:acyl-CoA dehydrogenase family protein [Phytohabitans suffuscus]BCB89583.1 putative monooxygenase [Phytohabitans suffuscus]